MTEPETPAVARSAMPTLRQLQFLAALQAHGSFVRAADAVGVTQPTLSAGIKELEAILRCMLVDRGPAGAALTPAGEEAAARAQRALAEVEDLVRAAHGSGAPLSGPFRLGAIPTIAPYLFPRLLPALRKAYPLAKLYLREDLTARLIDALRARALDAAVIALPFEAHGIETVRVFDDEFLLVAPPGHPLAAGRAPAPEDLRGEEVLLLEDGHCLREHALAVCAATPGRRSEEVQATSLATLLHMVAGGLGVTLAPRLAIDAGAAAGAAVSVRAFAEPVMGRAIGVAWRAGGAREADARRIAETLRGLV